MNIIVIKTESLNCGKRGEDEDIYFFSLLLLLLLSGWVSQTETLLRLYIAYTIGSVLLSSNPNRHLPPPRLCYLTTSSIRSRPFTPFALPTNIAAFGEQKQKVPSSRGWCQFPHSEQVAQHSLPPPFSLPLPSSYSTTTNKASHLRHLRHRRVLLLA